MNVAEFLDVYGPWLRGIVGLALIAFIFLFAMAAVWYERKLSADIQFRVGPHYNGPHGLLQLICDAIKLFTKEPFIPGSADKILFMLAPIFLMGSVFMMLVAIPMGAVFVNGHEYPIVATEMDISVLYIEAMSTISVFGAFLVSYGSNNKYGLLGAFRNFARMVGYEVPLGISVISVAIMAGSLNIIEVAQAQSPIWFIFLQPIGFIVFFVSLMADMGRLPFDQNESEEELTAGWITEVSSMGMGFPFFAEYIHMILGSFLVVLFFLGGWNLPGFITSNPVLGFIVPTVYFLIKVNLIILFIIAIRWSVPRYRIDQVVNLTWKKLLPLSLINLVWVVLFRFFIGA